MNFLRKFTAVIMLISVSAAAIYSLSIFLPKTKASADTAAADSSVESIIESVSSAVSVFEPPRVSSDVSSAVPAMSQGKVLGKIKTEIISPYKAPISYNKIYMKNSTGVTMDLKKELATPINFKITKSKEPEVLIYSTHTTESYMLEDRDYYTDKDATGTTDKTKNVLLIGSIIKKQLEDAGISVVQAETIHDHPQFSGCYDRSAETVRSYLEKYPSIKVVVDVHRDSVNYDDGTKCKPTVKINGKNAAQVMLVVGCGTDGVDNFPKWRENFRLAIRLQQNFEVMYPSLARPITFTARRYNLHLTTGSLLVEVGTEANTLDEAKYSAELVGKSLASVLNMLQD